MTYMDGQPTTSYSTQPPQTPMPQTPMPPAMHPGADVHRNRNTFRPRPTFLTTEFIAYVVVCLGVLLASAVISDSATRGDNDYFRANQAWLYITLLTVGYMVSRGIAKAGRGRDHERYDDSNRY